MQSGLWGHRLHLVPVRELSACRRTKRALLAPLSTIPPVASKKGVTNSLCTVRASVFAALKCFLSSGYNSTSNKTLYILPPNPAGNKLNGLWFCSLGESRQA